MEKHLVVSMLRKKRGADESLKAFAARVGVSIQYISDVFQSRRKPGPKILKFLGLESSYARIK